MSHKRSFELPKNRIAQQMGDVDTDFTMMTDENSDSPSDRVPEDLDSLELSATEGLDYGEMNEADAIASGYVKPAGALKDVNSNTNSRGLSHAKHSKSRNPELGN